MARGVTVCEIVAILAQVSVTALRRLAFPQLPSFRHTALLYAERSTHLQALAYTTQQFSRRTSRPTLSIETDNGLPLALSSTTASLQATMRRRLPKFRGPGLTGNDFPPKSAHDAGVPPDVLPNDPAERLAAEAERLAAEADQLADARLDAEAERLADARLVEEAERLADVADRLADEAERVAKLPPNHSTAHRSTDAERGSTLPPWQTVIDATMAATVPGYEDGNKWKLCIECDYRKNVELEWQDQECYHHVNLMKRFPCQSWGCAYDGPKHNRRHTEACWAQHLGRCKQCFDWNGKEPGYRRDGLIGGVQPPAGPGGAGGNSGNEPAGYR